MTEVFSAMTGFFIPVEFADSVDVGLLHEEVARSFDRVVRVLHGRWWLILVRVGQPFGSVIFPGVMVRWAPRIESASLRADRAIVALWAGRAVGRAELIRVMGRPVPVLHSRLRTSDPHVHAGIVRRHLVRVLLELARSLTSHSPHVLTATD